MDNFSHLFVAKIVLSIEKNQIKQKLMDIKKNWS